MYLPQFKGGVSIGKKTYFIIGTIIVCLVFSIGYYLCQRHTADSHDVTTTVRDAETVNRDAQTKLDDARTANQGAKIANQRATETAGDIADTNTKLDELNQSDADAIARAERVFTEIERRDK